MAYIGRPLNAGNLAVQSGTGDGSDTTPIATLDYSVGSSNSIAVYLDGVRQLAGTDFTATGTTLTFTTAPASGVGIDVYFLGLEVSIPTPADNTVSTAKLVDDAVTLAKMAPGTDGNIISYDASGNPVAIATGNDGQILTSAGAGAPPAFETLSAGKVLQCLQTMLTSSFTTTTTGGTNVTGLAVTITPSASSSKVLAFVTLSGSQTTANNQQGFYLKRGSTIIGVADSASSRRLVSQGMNVDHASHTSSNSWNVLDSPNTTSATVYQVAVSINGATAYVNRTQTDTDNSDFYRTVSTITVMEIAQ